ncbi:sensor histidine kinase [Janthinobacterium psychrotolerans]|uniref:histidine kinase n=1 Tax=Janthinobacterium psychrotolerans TaxID=1747903 RepID=A0A1A7BYT5_9BURK|nr:HAMP domain-containing sensor histidine kinase [Janthinobacterium psychrotolerans]OBV38692.1 His Kinase A (phospho-acceptor) domain-containing protein [Janthinobacterium psychrotolerans]
MIRIAETDFNQVDWNEWRTPLLQFSLASGLVVSAYDIAGARQIGPLLSTRTARFLGTSSLWRDDGPGAAIERHIVAAMAAGQDEADELFHGMRICSLPLTRAGVRYGALLFGWCMRDFSSPMACEQLAALIDVPGHALWNEVRLESPLTDARLATYRELLRTLASSLDRQRDTIDELNRVSRTRDVFLATVSHEMRTPLSALSMRVDLLLHTLQDMPPALQASLLAMRVHVRQEAAMVEDLIDAARTLTGTMSIARVPVSLGRIVRDAVSTIETNANEKRIVFSVMPANYGDHIELEADPRRLQQVLWNLMLNAIKFTPPGGSVGLNIASDFDGVQIRVHDSGQGIAPEDLPHVFGAFTLQSHANASGLGLGLYIARRIVELHGGAITVSSAGKDQGTSFTIYLPSRQAALLGHSGALPPSLPA